jgi:pimeloyl-ACP methyl ester carboxylesterase
MIGMIVAAEETTLGDRTRELAEIDLVGNDTGGAICQVLAARHGDRLRTLTLTNCDAENHFPPPAAVPLFEMARAGQLARLMHGMAVDHALARAPQGLGIGFERPERLTDADLDAYLAPFATLEGGRGLEAMLRTVDAAELRASRPALASFDKPTLLVWGTDDVFFGREVADELRDLIPGARDVVELQGAKLFFPDERGAELAQHLTAHWVGAAAAV